MRSVTLEPGVTKPVFLGDGVLDYDYQVNISIILTNLPQRTISTETRDRIAQMIFLKKEDVGFVEVEEFDDKTYLVINGFGSAGK